MHSNPMFKRVVSLYDANANSDKLQAFKEQLEHHVEELKQQVVHFKTERNKYRDEVTELKKSNTELNKELEKYKNANTSEPLGESMSNYIARLIVNPAYSDIKFIVDGRELKAHRVVLAARKAEQLFSPNSTTNQVIRVQSEHQQLIEVEIIKDISYETFQQVLHFVYTDFIDLNSSETSSKNVRPSSPRSSLKPSELSVSLQGLLRLLFAAEKFQLDKLQDRCVEMIISVVNKDNVLSVFDLLQFSKNKKLFSFVYSYISNNFSEIKKIYLTSSKRLSLSTNTTERTTFFKSCTSLPFTHQSHILNIYMLRGRSFPLHFLIKEVRVDLLKVMLRIYGGVLNPKDLTTPATSPKDKTSESDGSQVELENCFTKLPFNLKEQINALDEANYTPLQISVLNHQEEISDLLIANGADINVRDVDGNGLLHLAIDSPERSKKSIFYLLNKVFEPDEESHTIPQINTFNLKFQSPIHLAILHGLYWLVANLSERGSLLGCQDYQGFNELHYAVSSPHPENLKILRFLLEHDSFPNPLEKDVNKRDPFQLAVEIENYQAAVIFLQCLPPSVPHSSIIDTIDESKGKGYLQLSIEKKSVELLRALLEAGADANIRDVASQRTPLHIAAAEEEEEMMNLLIKHGANVNAIDNDGNTPLHLSVLNLKKKSAVLLVQAGVILSIPNNQNQTCLDKRLPIFGFSTLSEHITTELQEVQFAILTNVTKEPEWLSDEKSKFCQGCGDKFSLSLRKHHCRHCGRIICGFCSPKDFPIEKFGISKPVRLCHACFEFLALRKSS